METHQIWWSSSRHNCHLSTADDVHPKTFMLPQAKALVIPLLEVDSSSELYGTLTYALIISNMKKYNNIISALQTKMLVISCYILNCASSCFTTLLSGYPPWIPMTSAGLGWSFNASLPLGFFGFRKCTWSTLYSSSIMAALMARGRPSSRRGNPARTCENYVHHQNCYSAGQNSLPLGVQSIYVSSVSPHFCFFFFFNVIAQLIVSYSPHFCFFYELIDLMVFCWNPTGGLLRISATTPHRAWKPGRKLIRRPCCRSTGKPALSAKRLCSGPLDSKQPGIKT